MKIADTLESLKETIASFKANHKTIALVPTMGNLHKGHLSLIDEAKLQADVVVVSIFVNPMQFNNAEDLDNYPKTLLKDIAQLKARGVDFLFTPDSKLIYPDGVNNHTQVEVPFLTDILCGKDRPGHFLGVSTIVCKLFNLVQPDVAIFGEKDFQQLAIIRKMASDLVLPVKVIGKPTVREKNGLAMSSRNHHLTPEQQQTAYLLNQTLCFIREEIRSGNKDFITLQQTAMQTLRSHGFKPEYIRIAKQTTLEEADANDKKLVILGAAFLGIPRLIDNVTLEL